MLKLIQILQNRTNKSDMKNMPVCQLIIILVIFRYKTVPSKIESFPQNFPTNQTQQIKK